MRELIRVEDIEKYYGTKDNLTKALDRLSFQVDRGEFVGIMGASGSGKTTFHPRIMPDSVSNRPGSRLSAGTRRALHRLESFQSDYLQMP